MLLIPGLLLGLQLLLGLAPSALAERTGRAVVLSIGDGDTIRVRQGPRLITVRLACIDAPELDQATDGVRAHRYLKTRLTIGSSVTLRPQTMDRFGRTVAEVIGKTNLGLAMVEHGEAFVFRRHLASCDTKRYLDAEARAMRSRLGVWAVPGGIRRPWDFRRGKRAR
ncbi:thermonuclease family protein [Synechococcus sp. Cruz-9H2]|uniref:thermonuclease family protein n=1 Tax=unclassified Synechococcus TaxID=2626047 RepID=UPI0020CBC50B|nr:MULTISPECIES: thermonuclease family protein [unclassified Synechococcus]MCP9820722.1 thermonuclease family protein [Synechococcus sp. Cruz-9H2]MCP9845022.1 thermonuclease family protein [Synechococcus sp. Edmonson 11F2]MCP9857143.1 thermonuclease family protein [Synechococcus sp. Cruz-9C9]MCP9864428.1 thermonuclease family protein [Synechococcus sp. Cruz-7E5]MCP9871632.1 thermonuclease family protein [Synechococcus sp. Cruz-7B9]